MTPFSMTDNVILPFWRKGGQLEQSFESKDESEDDGNFGEISVKHGRRIPFKPQSQAVGDYANHDECLKGNL